MRPAKNGDWLVITVMVKYFRAMKLTYDRRHNVANIRFRERRTDVESVRVSYELTVDLAPDGAIYGIELLNANDQLRGADGGRLAVADESGGREDSLPLASGGRR